MTSEPKKELRYVTCVKIAIYRMRTCADFIYIDLWRRRIYIIDLCAQMCTWPKYKCEGVITPTPF